MLPLNVNLEQVSSLHEPRQEPVGVTQLILKQN